MEFALPDLGEGIYEAELVQWLVQPGEKISHGQTLLEAMTDKAVVSIASPFDGTVLQLMAEPGAQIKVGQPVLRYEAANGEANQSTPSAAPGTSHVQEKESRTPDARHGNGRGAAVKQTIADRPVRASPAVRRKARELGKDITTVTGTGPGGRILMKDLAAGPAESQKPAGAAPAGPAVAQHRPGSRLKIQGLRRAIATAMSNSKATIPHFSLMDECDVTELVRLRESLKETCQASSIKLTYLAFVVKAAVLALRDYPIVNASIDSEADEIVLHDKYHIGIAAATPQGLIVPVIHDADRKDILEIAREIERLTNEARSGKSRLDDLRGATFTVTSIGNIGGLISTPIIHSPEVAIMGIGKIVKRPVYDQQGQLRPADLVYLSFSFDHRVVDGDVGARFSNAVIDRLQNPAVLLLPPH